MKYNEQLQKNVEAAIACQPLLKAGEIRVAAKGGFITLTGTVNTYAKKMQAATAAKNIAGVERVIEKIEIKATGTVVKSDDATEIAFADVLKWNWPVGMVHRQQTVGSI